MLCVETSRVMFGLILEGILEVGVGTTEKHPCSLLQAGPSHLLVLSEHGFSKGQWCIVIVSPD